MSWQRSVHQTEKPITPTRLWRHPEVVKFELTFLNHFLSRVAETVIHQYYTDTHFNRSTTNFTVFVVSGKSLSIPLYFFTSSVTDTNYRQIKKYNNEILFRNGTNWVRISIITIVSRRESTIYTYSNGVGR